MITDRFKEKPNFKIVKYTILFIEIESLIYEIRGKQVVLDSDIAKIFCVTTENLNKSMKRNINRFSEEFCFQITKDEYLNLIFQFGISSLEYGGISLLISMESIEIILNISKN